MNIQEYIKKVGDRYKLGNATEHSYRGDLAAVNYPPTPLVGGECLLYIYNAFTPQGLNIL